MDHKKSWFRICKKMLNNVFDNLLQKDIGRWRTGDGFHIDLKLQACCKDCQQILWLTESQLKDDEKRYSLGYASVIRCACINESPSQRKADHKEYESVIRE